MPTPHFVASPQVDRHRLVDLSSEPERFFRLLPPDWQDGIVPYWESYESRALIFGLEIKGKVAGGGIVFHELTDETIVYGAIAEAYYQQHFCYIGYLWINPEYRGLGLGSRWLSDVHNLLPNRSFWLTVDDPLLQAFYERNGYKTVQVFATANGTDWILEKRA